MKRKHKVIDPLPGRKQDLTGTVFANLTVLNESGRNKHMNVTWLCRCICGNTTTSTTTELKSGHKISCGCKRNRGGSAMYNWTGCGDISGAYIYQIRQNALVRNLSFDLTKEYLWDLFLNQNKLCAFSGILLDFNKNKTASLDRIDCSVGYEIGNVHWVHKHINMMRGTHSPNYFIELCSKIASHSVAK